MTDHRHTLRSANRLISRRGLLAGLLAAGLALTAAPVHADDSIDEDTVPGEIHLTTRFPFVKFSLDGKEWDNHEYTKGNKVLVIRGVGRGEEHTVVVQPREPGWEPVTLTIAPEQWKRTVVRKGRARVLTFVYSSKVDFQKTPAEPKPEAGDKGKG